jgi:hypothetical protein
MVEEKKKRCEEKKKKYNDAPVCKKGKTSEYPRLVPPTF